METVFEFGRKGDSNFFKQKKSDFSKTWDDWLKIFNRSIVQWLSKIVSVLSLRDA